MYPTSPLGLHRAITEAALLCDRSGVGRVGIDFWGIFPATGKHKDDYGLGSISSRFPDSNWAQLNIGLGTGALAAPGPDGALSSTRFEMFREGVQEAEAASG